MYQFGYLPYISTNMVSVVSVTRLVLVFTLTLFLKSNIVYGITSTDQSELSQETVGLRYCNFSSNKQKLYGISDLLQCMNELATNAINQVNAKSFDDKERAFRRKGRPYYPAGYTGRPGSEAFSPYYDSRPGRPIYSGSGQADLQPNYYPSGIGYQSIPVGGLGALGGPGINILDALSSIAQYDDYKCVPRILCEMAAGGSPGNGIYKQGGSSTFEDLGKNALFGLLTAIDVGETSPILSFGKAAILGYSSKGNPEACYQEYRKCPRSSDDLVYYLNNHNGGFFRFFSNTANTPYSSLQGSYSAADQYVSARREPALPPGLSGPESDRTGTGELKFDNPVPSSRRDYGKSFFPGGRVRNGSRTFAFPGEEKLDSQQPLNRVSKSLVGYQDSGSGYQTGSGHVSPPFFPQDGKDQENNLIYTPNQSNSPHPVPQPRAQNSRITFPKARLYLPDDPINETMSTFTFPDGTKVKINVGFSKLFSEGYKKSLRRSFGNERGPQPINFDGFNMINLAEVFAMDKDAQVTHPCDMVCHDVRGTPVQFNQMMLNTGTLSTLMAPEMPILDLSRPVPCEVMCIDRAGERKQSSTILSHVLRPSNNGPRVTRPSNDLTSQQNLQDQYRKYAGSLNRKGTIISNVNVDQSNLRYSSNYPSIQSTNFQGFDNRQSQILSQDAMIQEQERLRELSLNSPRIMENDVQHFREARLISDRRPLRSKYDSEKIKLLRNERQQINTPIMFDNGQMPMLGGISYSSIASGPAVATIPRAPLPVSVPLPMPMTIGLMPSLQVMPVLRMRPVLPNALYPCTGSTCRTGGRPVKMLLMCGNIVYALPLVRIQVPVCAIAVQSENKRTGNNYHTLLKATKATWRDPGGDDYPQDFPSDNSDAHECVPIKYDKSADADYAHVPGLFYTTKKPLKYHKGKKKKLVIITDRGNVTYIKPS